MRYIENKWILLGQFGEKLENRLLWVIIRIILLFFYDKYALSAELVYPSVLLKTPDFISLPTAIIRLEIKSLLKIKSVPKIKSGPKIKSLLKIKSVPKIKSLPKSRLISQKFSTGNRPLAD